MGLPCERARHKQAPKQREKRFINIQQQQHQQEKEQQTPNNSLSRNKTTTSTTTVAVTQQQSTKTVIINAGSGTNNDDDINRNYQQFNDNTAANYNDAFNKRTSQNLTKIDTNAKTSKKILSRKNSKKLKETSCCSSNVAILSQLTQLFCNFSLLSYKNGSVASTGPVSLLASTLRNLKETYSQNLVRHSLCLYAATSLIFVLCYLTSPVAAAETNHTIFE